MQKIQLHADASGKFVNHLDGRVDLQGWDVPLGECRQVPQYFEVRFDHSGDSGPPYLNRQTGPIECDTAVHLGDGGRCYRFRIELPEYRVQRPSETLLTLGPDFFHRQRQGPGLKLRQLFGIDLWKNIGTKA